MQVSNSNHNNTFSNIASIYIGKNFLLAFFVVVSFDWSKQFYVFFSLFCCCSSLLRLKKNNIHIVYISNIHGILYKHICCHYNLFILLSFVSSSTTLDMLLFYSSSIVLICNFLFIFSIICKSYQYFSSSILIEFLLNFL